MAETKRAVVASWFNVTSVRTKLCHGHFLVMLYESRVRHPGLLLIACITLCVIFQTSKKEREKTMQVWLLTLVLVFGGVNK